MTLNNAQSHFSTLQKKTMCLIRSRATPYGAPTTLLSRILKYSSQQSVHRLPAIPIPNPPSLPPPSRFMCHPSSVSALPHHTPSCLVSVVPQPILIHAVVLAGWSLRNLPSSMLFASIAVAETRPISPVSPYPRPCPRPSSPSVPSRQPWLLCCSINGRGRRAVGGIAT